MRTARQARMVLPGPRARVYEIDLIEKPGTAGARYLVNFRYGWQGAILEEGTRTPDAVTEKAALAIFESMILARKNQGYLIETGDAQQPKTPVLAVVTRDANPRDAILAARLRALDGLPDIKAASLLRRLGELRLKHLCQPIAAAANAILIENNRPIALRTLTYAVHRTDDGSGLAKHILEKLAACPDAPTAQSAAMVRVLRSEQAPPSWDAAPLVLRTASALPDPAARAASAIAYFQASIAASQIHGQQTAQDTAPDSGNWNDIWTTPSGALCALYARGSSDPIARELTLVALNSVPLQPPLFKALRRILQVAEALDDAEVFALLHARFDDVRSTVKRVRYFHDGTQRAWLDGKVIEVAEEAARPNARISFTETTRGYLRRRGWRTLRRLGDAGDPAYVAMSAAVLLTLDDTTAKPVPPRTTYTYDPEARQSRVIHTSYPDFPDRHAAHYIMHGNASRLTASPTTLRWRFAGDTAGRAGDREEPFAELWTAHPQTVWQLARSAKAGIVLEFAARVLRGNAAFVATIPTSAIASLLRNWQPVAERLKLGIALAEQRIATEGLKPELAAALMSEATLGGPLVKLYLGGRPDLLGSDSEVFAAAISGCAVGNHAWFDALALKAAEAAPSATRLRVLNQVIADIDGSSWPDSEQHRGKLIAALLTQIFPAEIATLNPEIILHLSRHASQTPQLIAAMLANTRTDGATLVDVGLLAQSSNPELRAAGIAFFAKRPLDEMIADLESVAAFLTADAGEPRTAAIPIAERIGRERPDAARTLAEMLLPSLFRTEQHDGLRDHLVRVLSTHLRDGVVALGPDTIWTLLRARSEPARRLGAEIIDELPPTAFSIRQLARIACNDQVKARRWALQQLTARSDDVRAAPEEGFALLDCEFEDSREAGYALYRNIMRPEDWSPEALVAVSDSITEPAQRFGREMIGKVFEDKNAEFLLSRLAEHPAPGFRLLVARLMRDYVKNDSQRLMRLVPAIETTLLQVRKSRAAKNQVFAFLEEQIEADSNAGVSERMAILAPVLERAVATCAIADRARLLSLLATVKQSRPELAPRAQMIAREARG